MDPTDALRRCGGAARFSRLTRLGVSPRTLGRACRRGDVIAMDGGGYALPGANPDLATAVRLGGVLSHASAAQWHGFPPWHPVRRLFVTVPIGTTIRESGVHVHRGRLTPADIDPFLPVTHPLRTLLDCGRRLPFCDAVVVMDAALGQGAVKAPELRDAAEAAMGPGSSRLRRAARHADELAASALESVLRLLLDLILDVDVRSQVQIPGAGPVDFLVNGWLVIETDGFEFHADREHYRKDRRRLNALMAQGYVLLRFTWEDLRFRPAAVLTQIEQVLARRGR